MFPLVSILSLSASSLVFFLVLGITNIIGSFGLTFPGKNAEALFYVRIPIDHVEHMKEIIDREGAITLLLHLYFSILYNAGRAVGIPQKPINFTPSLNLTFRKLR